MNSPLQITLISEISNKPLLLKLGAETLITVTYFVNNPEKGCIFSCATQVTLDLKQNCQTCTLTFNQ